jgi:hypothetical protein
VAILAASREKKRPWWDRLKPMALSGPEPYDRVVIERLLMEQGYTRFTCQAAVDGGPAVWVQAIKTL